MPTLQPTLERAPDPGAPAGAGLCTPQVEGDDGAGPFARAPGAAADDKRGAGEGANLEQTADIFDLAEAARGGRIALARLYDRHAPLLLALGIRLLRDRREAEDVLHDCFVEVWKHAGDYDARRASVRTWLVLRMRSRCLDRLRSAAWTRRADLPEGHTHETPHAQDARDASDDGRLEAALGALPEEQRAVIALAYFEGLSSSEIAERIRIPIGTVKSRVRSAMNRLRALMGAHSE